jgi:hypothetical protein
MRPDQRQKLSISLQSGKDCRDRDCNSIPGSGQNGNRAIDDFFVRNFLTGRWRPGLLPIERQIERIELTELLAGEHMAVAGFSLRLHRRDAYATKKMQTPQSPHFNTQPLTST